MTREVRRGFIAEWTVTIILLLFATTTLVQAFVIPSASMESTLLVGDHVLVDKLVFSPGGPVSGHILPYRDVRRGDIIGAVGTTGRVTAPHLHYEVHNNGVPMNPYRWLQHAGLYQPVVAPQSLF